MLPDIKFAEYTLSQTVRELDRLVQNGEGHYACFCEAKLFVSAWRDPALVESLSSATHVFADGVSVLLLARLQGKAVPKRIPGPIVMPELCDFGQSRGYRHFFLGGEPGVAEALAEHLAISFPEIQVVGTYTPPFTPFTEEDNESIHRAVEDANPDILWVGLGAPKQEYWISSQRDKLSVPLVLGVGAAFDFHAGKKRWAPLWIRKIGMEWAFRMITGGPKTFFKNMKFVSVMFCALVAAVFERLLGKHKVNDE